MANFVVRSCTPNPHIDVAVASPETAAPMRSTTNRGVVDVSVDTNRGPTSTEGTVQWFCPTVWRTGARR
jgi:hypothetical protein